jgi:hypothetical protein
MVVVRCVIIFIIFNSALLYLDSFWVINLAPVPSSAISITATMSHSVGLLPHATFFSHYLNFILHVNLTNSDGR